MEGSSEHTDSSVNDVIHTKNETKNKRDKHNKVEEAKKEDTLKHSVAFDPLIFLSILFLVLGIICAIGFYKIRDKSYIQRNEPVKENDKASFQQEISSKQFTEWHSDKVVQPSSTLQPDEKIRTLEKSEYKDNAEKEETTKLFETTTTTEDIQNKHVSDDEQKKQETESVITHQPEDAISEAGKVTTVSTPSSNDIPSSTTYTSDINKDDEDVVINEKDPLGTPTESSERKMDDEKSNETSGVIGVEEEIARIQTLINKEGFDSVYTNLMNRPLEGNDNEQLQLLLDRALILHQMTNVDEDEHNDRIIQAYEDVLKFSKITDEIATHSYRSIADRLATLGNYSGAIYFAEKGLKLAPNNFEMKNELGMYYLYEGDTVNAKEIFKSTINDDPDNSVAAVNYGLLALHHDRDPVTAAKYLIKGLETDKFHTFDPRYFVFLYEALVRLDRLEEAQKYNLIAYQHGLFRAPDQLSLSNIEHLKGEPIWDVQATPYKEYYEHILGNITEDVMKEISSSKLIVEDLFNVKNGYIEYLPVIVDGNIFQCDQTPMLCDVLKSITPLMNCRVCDSTIVKFGTQSSYWKHFGPSNFRLRSIFPIGSSSSITVEIGNKTTTVSNGSYLIIDDSFIHEIANHNEEEVSYVLIVDMWHPELTEDDKQSIGSL